MNFIETLKKGMEHKQVEKLQVQLTALGYYNGDIDGQFGTATQKAVLLFQRVNHFEETGIVHDEMWSLLFNFGSEHRRWKNFSYNEIVNPLFDHCPYYDWDTVPKWLKERLYKTMDVVQAVRDFIRKPTRLNSTYRPKSKGSAHSEGRAIDIQLINGSDVDYLNIMDWLKRTYSKSNNGFRAILEWAGKRPWLHIDTGFRPQGFYVMYPQKRGGMAFREYEGKLPQDYV